jgi:hypothetical protein
MELAGYSCMCKGRGGKEIFFARRIEVECWRFEDGRIQRVRSIKTIESVNNLLALDHGTVLAV